MRWICRLRMSYVIICAARTRIRIQNQITEAQKHSRYAVSALGFNDVKTALENLEKAMNILKGHS